MLLLAALLCGPAHAGTRPSLHRDGLGEPSMFLHATARVAAVLADAVDLVGIRYRRGGVSPQTGFDCSGLVDHVFREGLGLILPHSARAIAREGRRVKRANLRPGDLVFFNTMRRAFSHVGIYLGDHLFVHAPHTGATVRIEDLRERYWSRRFDGARRLVSAR